MPRFGRNPFPFGLGGGASTFEIEHQALLDAYAPGWDSSTDTINHSECFGFALAVTMIWQVNRRTANQVIPMKRLEELPTWEQILKLSPTRDDPAVTRRRLVAAKLRGLAGNALHDIQDVVRTIAGNNYVGTSAPDAAHAWAYWPGVNPGPPGLEWSSNRASITITLTRTSLSDADFINLLERMTQSLNAMIPAWMQYCIGVDEGGFVCSVGTLSVTLLGGGP